LSTWQVDIGCAPLSTHCQFPAFTVSTIDDVQAAAEVVRDAVTVFVHPTHVEAAVKAGISMEPAALRVMATLIRAFTLGVSLLDT